MGIFEIVLTFVVISSIAVAFHAKGQNKTALWGVLVFLTGIFGLLAYAISLASD